MGIAEFGGCKCSLVKRNHWKNKGVSDGLNFRQWQNREIVNLRLSFFESWRLGAHSVLLGASPKPRDFLRHSSENHACHSSFLGSNEGAG